MLNETIMKTILLFAFVVISINAPAQTDNAYWVIEKNINSRNTTTVRFYSADHNLLDERVIQGKVININKNKHKRLLDQLLSNYMNPGSESGKKHKSKSSV